MLRSRILYALMTLAVVIVVVVLFRVRPRETSWPPEPEEEAIPTPPLQPLSQLPHVSVWFNSGRSAVYREPYRGTWRLGDNLEELIIEAIEDAQVSVNVAVQELNLPGVAQALCRKHRDGVRVRIILENAYNRVFSMMSPPEVRRLSSHARAKYDEFLRLADLDGDGHISLEEAVERDAITILRACGVPIVDDTEDGSKGSGIMHHKFMVLDGATVVFGSANFTMSGVHGDFANPATRGNANHLLRFESPDLAAHFEDEFAVMWGDGPGGEKDSRFGKQKPHRGERMVVIDGCPVMVKFSPTPGILPYEQTTNALIASIVRKASRSVDMALFVFSAQEIVDALAEACVRHPALTVRGVFDASFASRYYSETLDMWRMALQEKDRYETSSETGMPNRPWDFDRGNIGIAILPEGDKLHHKFAVVDSELVITGSHNWSAAANTNNDEAIVVFHSEAVAAHFLREMDRLTASMHVGPTRRLVERVGERGGYLPPHHDSHEPKGRPWPAED
ncbi:competence protein ComE [Candidatus Fermentibacteria bacterium]|nr:competence protein ComE [Candidatus Fermentibacteria bacterium]